MLQNFNYDLRSMSRNSTEFIDLLTQLQDTAQEKFGCQISLIAIDSVTGAKLLQCTGPAANRQAAKKALRKAFAQVLLVWMWISKIIFHSIRC